MAEQLPTEREPQSDSLVDLIRDLLAEQDEFCRRVLGERDAGTYTIRMRESGDT